MAAALVAHLGTVLAAEGDVPVWLLLLGPAGAVGVYVGLYQYYRNTGKSHSFERETRVTAQPVTGQERKVDEVKGTKKTSIDGAKQCDHRERVQRLP
ncbi:MAG: hypothetical protein ACK5CE_21100 [Actinomycetes bacterium]